jgi:hypothetical protein
MKIHLVGAKMFHVDGQAGRRARARAHKQTYADRHEEANSNFS